MRVVTTTPINWQGSIHPTGTELDVPDETAEWWERTGACKRVKQSKSRAVESVRTEPTGESGTAEE